MSGLAREIERLRRRHAAVLAEVAAAIEAPSAWELAGGTLCWHVVLCDVLEPDVDVEMLEDAVVVRGAAARGAMRLALLPVPPPYDVRRVAVRYRHGFLEVRIERGGGHAG